jgi:hypothetical protein
MAVPEVLEKEIAKCQVIPCSLSLRAFTHFRLHELNRQWNVSFDDARYATELDSPNFETWLWFIGKSQIILSTLVLTQEFRPPKKIGNRHTVIASAGQH